ncbi:MAG TPA: UPF0280 family protein [Sphaerochaeta sp.]|nr:UPF0280 family protein [Sphaerochaeta sp.]
MYQERTYRKAMGLARFASITFAVGESDLWIGYTPSSVDGKALVAEGARLLRRLRNEILSYPDPAFLSSLVPLKQRKDADMGTEKDTIHTGERALDPDSPFIAGMLNASRLSGTGPMASVAGAIAQEIGSRLKKKFSLEEIVVENGGDLYIDVLKPLLFTFFAGDNSLSGKVSIVVEPKHCPVGVCTSSAKIGHSHSFGRADAVMVACSDAALADAYATAFCNKVLQESDVEKVTKEMNDKEEILSALVLLDTKLALCGQLEVRSQA